MIAVEVTCTCGKSGTVQVFPGVEWTVRHSCGQDVWTCCRTASLCMTHA